MTGKISRVLPGTIVLVVVAIISYVVSKLTNSLISSMLVAIIFGVALRNLSLVRNAFEDGLKFCSKTVLRTGVVLLGLKLSIPQVAHLGWGPVFVIVATVLGTFLVTLLLGKLMRVAHTTTLLTATGTSICGAAAVAGMSAVTHRRGPQDEAVDSAAATAIASVTLFGTLGLIIFPYLAQAIGLTLTQTGVWLGAAIHEVGQVVAAGGIAGHNQPTATLGEELLNVATVTKLGRVATLAILVAVMGGLEQRNAAKWVREKAARTQVSQVLSGHPVDHAAARPRGPILPLFVAGFIGMVLVRSILEWVVGAPLPEGGLKAGLGYIDQVATFLLTVAMGAMGAGVNLRTIAKTGLKALALGMLAATLAAVVSLAVTLLCVQ